MVLIYNYGQQHTGLEVKELSRITLLGAKK